MMLVQTVFALLMITATMKVMGNEIIDGIIAAIKDMESNSVVGKRGKVCYDELGCFDSAKGVFKYIGILPSSPEEVATSFVLFTRDNREQGIVFTYRDVSPAVQVFKKIGILMFMTHGFASEYNATWMTELKDIALDNDRAVILVDWREGACVPNYLQASVNTELVGRQIAVVLQKLMKALPDAVTSNIVHFVGHSLGAHIGRFLADYFGAISDGLLIHQLTALDPAGPMFENFGVYVNKSAAHFVDVLHTSAGDDTIQDAARGHMGMHSAVGHLDIYANGGTTQPGCPIIDITCAHRRSHDYYMWAARLTDPWKKKKSDCFFESYSCKGGLPEYKEGKCERIGYLNAICFDGSDLLLGRAIQFVDTTGTAPFCKPLPKLSKRRRTERRCRKISSSRESYRLCIKRQNKY